MKSPLIHLLCLVCSLSVLNGQDVPGVIPFNTKDDPILQSWMITQDCEGIIYVANTDGVLIYNGLSWARMKLPANKFPRTIFTGADCKVYTGGYETAGFIDRSDPAHPVYIPLADSLLAATNQEIWNIFGNTENLFFQSFSNVYRFHLADREFLPLAIPSNIMLGNTIGDRIFLPRITQGLFEFDRTKLEFLPVAGTEKLPENSKIASVVPHDETNRLILATQYNGIFYLTGQQIFPLDNPLIDQLKKEQINKMIRLRNGDYAIGTILNGVYITADLKTVKYHFNRSTGLTNNTILALFEDKSGDLWVGLDKGLNLLKISDPALYHHDIQDLLGTIFVVEEFRDELYLGTNKGLFVKSINSQFKLIDQSQGQVWSLLKIGNDLLCGHNAGTFLVENENFRKVSTITGGWAMESINDSLVLQSSYIGLVLLEKVNGSWRIKKRLDNGEILIERFVLLGHTIVGYHAHYGICILRLSDDFSRVVQQKIINHIQDTPINSSLILSKTGEHIFAFFEGAAFILEEDEFLEVGTSPAHVPIEESQAFKKDFTLYLHLSEESKEDRTVNFRALPNKLINDAYIVNSSDGYVTYPDNYNLFQDSLNGIFIDAAYANNAQLNVAEGELENLLPVQNDLLIQLGNQFYDGSASLEYQLNGWDEQWFELPKDGRLNFINLDDGAYELLIRNGFHIRPVLKFVIPPHWYESWTGIVLYVMLAGLLIWLTILWNKRKIRLETERLEAEKRKEMESIRMKAYNEKLKRELTYKSKMLANSAMTLIQKNKMLGDLKGIIKKEDPEHWESGRSKQKMLNIIRQSINSDEDWEIFERNFEEVHEDFLKKLKDAYPNITSGEIRLAAYIRMNLPSKQIAPLMNISVRSVENKRYRLRKKMGLSGTQSLTDHLMRL